MSPVLVIGLSVINCVLMFIVYEVGKQRGISVGFALAKELNERWKKVYDDQNTQWNNFLFQLTGMDVLSMTKDNQEPEPVKPKLSLVKKDE